MITRAKRRKDAYEEKKKSEIVAEKVNYAGTRVVSFLKNLLLLVTFLALFPLFAFACWCLIKDMLMKSVVCVVMFFVCAIVNYLLEV